jgi:hypothetical protein
VITDTGRSERAPSAGAATLAPRAAIWRLRRPLAIGGRDLWLWALPALFAAVYLIVLAVSFGQVITSINLYGDAIIAPVLGKLIGQAPAGSHVVLGHHAYYEEFLFLRATSGLPFYRQLWEVAPLIWTLIGVGLLTWSARRSLGGFAALLTASAVLCLGTLGRSSFFTFDWHGLTVIHTIFVGAALVWLIPRADRIRWPGVIALGVALGLISALPMASDVLFLFWALIPMLIAAAAVAWRSEGPGRWTPLAFAAITAVVSLLAGAEIAHILRAGGVTATQPPYTFVSSAAMVVNNVEVLFEGYMALGGGYFFGMPINLVGLLVLVSGILIVAAIVLGLIEVRRMTVAYRKPSGAAVPATRRAYVAFWASSLVIQAIVFVVTGIPKFNTGSSRYALAGYVAVMALFPLLARRGPRWRAAVTAGVCAFALSSIVQLAQQPFAAFGRYPTPSVAARVLQFARTYHVQYGYAGYWDAPDLTWLTRFDLKIYPIESGCGPHGICPTAPARIDTWYVPRPGTRSMLIADSAVTGVASIDPRLGAPLASMHIGTLTVAVYPFDIASKFSG